MYWNFKRKLNKWNLVTNYNFTEFWPIVFFSPLVFSSYLPSYFTKFNIQGQFWTQNYMRIPKLVLLLIFEQILMEKIRFNVTEGEICFATLYICFWDIGIGTVKTKPTSLTIFPLLILEKPSVPTQWRELI